MTAALPAAIATDIDCRTVRVRAPYLRFEWAPDGIEFEIRVPRSHLDEIEVAGERASLFDQALQIGGVMTLNGPKL